MVVVGPAPPSACGISPASGGRNLGAAAALRTRGEKIWAAALPARGGRKFWGRRLSPHAGGENWGWLLSPRGKLGAGGWLGYGHRLVMISYDVGGGPDGDV